jgi:hypothetical protein
MIRHAICVESHKLPDEKFLYRYVVTVGDRVLAAGNATNYRNAWLWALTALNGHIGNLGLG